MLSRLLRRLSTSPVPTLSETALSEPPPPTFRGMPQLVDDACRGDDACAVICPTAAITVTHEPGGWTWRLDRAACIACGQCMEACPYLALSVSPEFELASRTRADLVETVHFEQVS